MTKALLPPVKSITPTEYCSKWMPVIRPDIRPEHHGYREACIWLLTRVTKLQYGTIKNWGKDFERVPPRSRPAIEITLGMSDALNEIKCKADPFYPSDLISH